MITHNLVQGSREWLAHRAKYFNASDAPAMMGCSPYKTRDELLEEYYTGLTAEVDAQTQERFDDGHRFEALARPLAEEIIAEQLYPLVATNGMLGASFDGITMDETVIFEHKTLNDSIRQAFEMMETIAPEYRVQDGHRELPMHYRVQMEQQLYVSGAEKCLFMATVWNDTGLAEKRDCWYFSNQELRLQILNGWMQFEADLANYVPMAKVLKPVGKTPENLPALHIEVSGMVIASNLADYRDHALAVFASINRKLETDQHFADSEKAIKWCGEVESRANAAWDHALSQTASIDELRIVLFSVRDEARNLRLELEKLVKNRKEEIRNEVVSEGRKSLVDYVAEMNKELGRELMPVILADFNGAIKNKRTIESLRNAVNTELAKAKVDARNAANKIIANLNEYTVGNGAEYEHLFPDLKALVLKDPDDFKATFKLRITEFAAKEQAKQIAAAVIAAPVQQAVMPIVPNEPISATGSWAMADTGNAISKIVPVISFTRQALNEHLDTLNDDELERVLRFCQSRYPLQQAA